VHLYYHGIWETLLQLLRELLTGHTHQTRVRLLLSSVTQLLSGVVQGSGIGIGPLLFLSYINKLAEILGRAGVNVKLFADNVNSVAARTSARHFLQTELVTHGITYLIILLKALVYKPDKCSMCSFGKTRLKFARFT